MENSLSEHDNEPKDERNQGETDKEIDPGGATRSNDSEIVARSGASLVGCRLGDYQIMRKLGRGGMADVYAARHLSLGRDVAIKVLRQDFARDQDYVSRFRREARAAAKLNHSNIVQVYDVGSVDETHFIAQELIDGKNLKEELNAKGSLSADEAVRTLAAVASALEAANEVGITHRDIKPENIMRSTRGEIKVADFGLARLGGDADASRANLTQAGLTMGTPRYMSPEQVQGKVADVRSDLYALGVTMYHLLAGRPPFEADDPLALAVMHLHETPEPLDRARGRDDIPEWLIAVVARLMSKLPADRFQSPQELRDALASEAAIASDDRFDTVGTAAATIRLQRITDAAKKRQRKSFAKWAFVAGVPLLCGLAAAAYASNRKGVNVGELLRPETVVKAPTVEGQFLNAVNRNDVSGWESVSAYFPKGESSKNRAYFAKSMLQLARFYVDREDNPKARKTLDQILDDAKVERKYRLVALARKRALLEKMKADSKQIEETRHQLLALHRVLSENNPAAIEFFNEVVSREQRVELEIGKTETIDP